MEFDQELANEFVAESKENLSSIEEDLLALERTKENPDKELVNKVFRSIHSIKGSAGFLSFRKIGALSHQMETLLAVVRSGELAPHRKCVDTLLEGVDILLAMLDDIARSETFDIQMTCEKLSALLLTTVTPEAENDLATSVALRDAAGTDPAVNVNAFRFDRRRPGHDHLYLFRYDLSEMGRMRKSLISLIKSLLQTGEIIEGKITVPNSTIREGPPDLAFYEVVYSTVLEPDLAREVSELPQKDITILEVPQGVSGAAAGRHESGGVVMREPASMPPPPPPAAEDSFARTRGDKPPEEAAPREQSATAKEAQKGGESIRINIEILDRLMNLAGELVLVRNQQLMSFDRADPLCRANVQRLDLVTSELQETIMRTRMQPIGNIFNKFPRVVRDLGAKLDKRIELQISGNEVEVDKTILESLADPLTHLVRNCCDHAIETPEARSKVGKPTCGRIHLSAYHEGGQINIEIEDDGAGISAGRVKTKALQNGLKSEADLARMNDKEVVSLIFLPGFSTAETVSDVSGRGVGMDVVKTSVEKLGGSVDIDTDVGKGTTVRLRLPLTLAIIPCLIVVVGGHRYAIPQTSLEELVRLYDDEVWTKIECAQDQEVYRLRDRLLTMVRLDEILRHTTPLDSAARARIAETHRLRRQERREAREQEGAGESLVFAVVKADSSRMGLIVDHVLGTEEIVVKPMHSSLKHLSCYAGATVMGDGKVALILDIDGVAEHAGIEAGKNGPRAEARQDGVNDGAETQTLLLFKSGEKEDFALALPQIRRVERIQQSQICMVGQTEYVTVDGTSTRIVRLDALLDVSPCAPRDELFLILPARDATPCGLLVSSLTDILQSPVRLDADACRMDGVLGTAIIRNRMTLFPDIHRLFEWSRTPSCCQKEKTP